MIKHLFGSLTPREYFYYVFHPRWIKHAVEEADQAVRLAELHDSLRRQAETALEQERERNERESLSGLLR
jgi:hypothetical protein